MKFEVVFVEYGFNFVSDKCSEGDADILLSRLAEKGITAAYKREAE